MPRQRTRSRAATVRQAPRRGAPCEESRTLRRRAGRDDPADLVGVGTEPHRLGWRVEVHVADGAAHRVYREELLGLRIEADELLQRTAFREPQPSLVVLGQRVGTRARATGRLPFLRFPSLGIDAPQETA